MLREEGAISKEAKRDQCGGWLLKMMAKESAQDRDRIRANDSYVALYGIADQTPYEAPPESDEIRSSWPTGVASFERIWMLENFAR